MRDTKPLQFRGRMTRGDANRSATLPLIGAPASRHRQAAGLKPGLALSTIAVFLLGGSALGAQTLTITPQYPGVKVGTSVQLTAKINGVVTNAVSWAVNRIVGGNSTVGTITATGFYTAPAVVPPQTEVTAVSTANPSFIAADYMNVLAPGPVITSVSPNPLPVGNLTVSIQGTGFQPGATVLQNYGSVGNILVRAKSVTPTLVTADIYQGPATSASFTVQNPGSAPSNMLTVAANSHSGYQLTVVNGTGSGMYASGATATISANPAPAGEVFTDWTGARVANAKASKTTLKMPAADTTVTANYGQVYVLTVVNGTGGGSYLAGTSVTIKANGAPAGQSFLNWTGATVANATSASTTLKMPAANTTVTANYSGSHALTVVNGTGSGSYAAGTVVPIAANAAPAGRAFQNWSGATVANATSASTTLTMPAADASVTANFATAYTLTVVGGTGGGSYLEGAVVPIKANTAAGQSFLDWTGATVTNATSASTTLKMPAANTTVTANYSTLYTLAVNSGTGGGTYAAGATVAITANAPLAGQSFLDWTGATVANPTSASTTLTMPAANTTVTANYSVLAPGSASCANMSLGVNASLNGLVPFPPTSAWNRDISSTPVDPDSNAITSAAGFAGLHLHHDFSSVAGGNYGIPYVVVDSSTTPLVPINVLDYASESDVAAAPFPSGAPIEGAPADCSGWPDSYVGDSHVLVLDRNACMLYETFNTHRCGGAWNASSETIWDLKNAEQRPWGWTSADAAGLPIFPGLIRYDEVASGAINHAIRFTMQVTKNNANGGYFVPPASHAAGVYWGVSNVMGMRIRLKSTFDISGYSPVNQIILTAMKKYGMILADNGGYFFFQGVPDSRWNDNDLHNLDAIQSSNFEVVQMTPEFPGYDSVTAPSGPPPTIQSFTASASTVTAGTPVTLAWVTTNDSYDFIDKLGGVHGTSVTVIPSATTTYVLNATNQYGRSTMQVTVTVK